MRGTSGVLFGGTQHHAWHGGVLKALFSGLVFVALGSFSVCVHAGVCAGVGLCGCYSQHTKGGREVCSKQGSCARRGGPISHTVSLVPGPSMGAHPTPQDPPLPLSAWQMEIFWIERNINIRDKNQLIKI